MAVTIQHKRSSTASSAPTAGDLADGEIAINTADEVLYVKNAAGTDVFKVGTVPDGTSTVPDGTATSQTLRWDGSAWEETSDLVVDSSGRVGIGVNNPDESLVVDGTAKVQSTGSTVQLRLDRTDGDEWLLQAGLGSGNDECRILNSTESTEAIRFLPSGNVGIGDTSPEVKLVVDGSTRVTTSFIAPSADTFSAPAFTWNGDSNTGMYRVAEDVIGFTTGATERMRIDSTGNVGIQTPSAFNNTDDRLSIDCGFSTPNKGITLFGSNVDGGGSLTFAEGSVDGEYAVITGQRDGNSASNCFLSFKVSSDWDFVAATERMRISSSGVVTLGGASGDRVAGTDNSVGQDQIHKFLTISQAQYDALGTPDNNTLYIIV